MFKRWGIALLGTLTLLLGVAATPAQAAPPARDNSFDEPLYFLKGYSQSDPAGANCTKSDTWGPALEFFENQGWRGPLHKVAFYGGDVNCDIRISNGDRDTSLRELGRLLAWDIYNRYSSKGRSVDLISHSMGGLIAQAALTGIHRDLPGWPPYLYVEDAVNIGTPHSGILATFPCRIYGSTQCAEMSPGSDFLDWVSHNPQSTQGTDWTLIGSEDDRLVRYSALRMWGVGHRVMYQDGNGFSHATLNEITTGRYPMVYENPSDPAREDPRGAAPVRVAMNALYWWRSW